MNELKTYEYYLLISLSVIAGFVLGYFIEKLILKRFQVYSLKTKWKYDDIIAHALKRLIIVWTVLIFFSIAVQYFPIGENFRKIASKVSFSLTVLTFSMLTGRVLVGLIKGRSSGVEGVMPSTSIIANITRVVVFIVGILVILQTLGISVTPVLTALGVGGLAVALALQDTLSNLFSGIQVIASKQIRTGDYVQLDSLEEGYITDITWRNTTIRALRNNIVIIPNSKMASAIVRNYSLPEKEIAFSVDVGVSYDSDLEKVEAVCIKTAKHILNTVEGGSKDFEPFVRFHTFGDSSINLSISLGAQEFVNQYAMKHEFVKALHKSFRESAIEIPFPIRTLIHKNETPAITS
jgi:small-conductance mechanosensitive channel